MRVLGIDPGSLFTGYGLIHVEGSSRRYLDHGVWSFPKQDPFEKRLVRLGERLGEFILQVKPSVVVVEQIFLGQNVASAFKLGQVRGVCMYYATKSGAQLREIAPRKAKKLVTGSGASSKEQVQMLITRELGIPSGGSLDATDALALALGFSLEYQVEQRLRAQSAMGVL